MGKRSLSDEDIKARYITPAITGAGWDIKKQVRFEFALRLVESYYVEM